MFIHVYSKCWTRKTWKDLSFSIIASRIIQLLWSFVFIFIIIVRRHHRSLFYGFNWPRSSLTDIQGKAGRSIQDYFENKQSLLMINLEPPPQHRNTFVYVYHIHTYVACSTCRFLIHSILARYYKNRTTPRVNSKQLHGQQQHLHLQASKTRGAYWPPPSCRQTSAGP